MKTASEQGAVFFASSEENAVLARAFEERRESTSAKRWNCEQT